MLRKLTAAIFLLLMLSGISLAATTTNTSRDYDPFHLYPQYLTSGDGSLLNGDSNFYYQLRDITGASRNSEVGGPQWFSTVYENYYSYYEAQNNTSNNTRTIYRRTMGGEIDEIPFSTVGDILDGFNFVFAEEPEPYEAWTNFIYNQYYDVYPDPLESLCVVISGGKADLKVKFGNPYARHFPFWWNWTRTTRSKKTTNWQWWKRNYDWTDESYPTVEPVKYIYSPSDKGIFERGNNGVYSKIYNFNIISKDVVEEETVRRKIISGEVIPAYAVVGDIDATYVLSEKPVRAENFWSADIMGHYLISRDIYEECVYQSYVISRDALSRDNKVMSGDIISGMFLSGDLVELENVIHNRDDVNYGWVITDNSYLLWGDDIVLADGRPRIPGYYLVSNYYENMYAFEEFENINVLSGEIVLEDIPIYERYEITNSAKKILLSSSGDVESGVFDFYSGDVTRLAVSGDTVYDTLSIDIRYPLKDTLRYRVSGDSVYDFNYNLLYTIESAGNSDNSVYICEPRTIGASIVVHGFDDNYTVKATPIYQGDIHSGEYLSTSINIVGDPYTYGSKLGYITFRQKADFAPGYTNFREATPIPMVIANVSNGNAADNPLIFDMAIFDTSGDVVKRTKFKWDAQSNITKDLGTFFMMTPINTVYDMPYRFETRIANRTGTRYELYRYTPGGGGERNLTPAYWKYDLTEDVYGTLPTSFLLDAHSQIAPGLVTVYNQSMNYTNINMGSDQSSSFRLYEHDNTNPKNLTLNYKRIAGMLTNAAPQPLAENNLVTVQGFSMYFTDVNNDSYNSKDEIRILTGKKPEMVDITQSGIITPSNIYINSSALDAFLIDAEVPEELQARVSYDISVDKQQQEGEQEGGEADTQEAPANQDNNEANTAAISVAEETVVYNTDASGKAALQPIAVRMKIPRQTQLLAGIWDQLEAAEDPVELFNIFARYGTIWVRSAATREYDTNLFRAIDSKGSAVGATAADCVRAFIYEDYLYLDFIVIIVDAKSKKEDRTAYIEVFNDDNVPYVLIGDGLMDKRWQLAFYVSNEGDNPTAPYVYEEEEVQSSSATAFPHAGEGCNSGIFGLGLLILIAAMNVKLKR